MTGFALYRLPHAAQCTLLSGAVDTCPSCAHLNGREGFVIAPFQPDATHPVCVIRPAQQQELRVCEVDGNFRPDLAQWLVEQSAMVAGAGQGATRAHYAHDFAAFHAALSASRYQKLVLARCEDRLLAHSPAPFSLFRMACDCYPRLFIALVFTPASGLWLTATPEILLTGHAHTWHTMALAGTMRLSDEQLLQDVPQVAWSVKNIQEQRYVATYIAQCLRGFATDIVEQGPLTARAAHLVHLRSDFTFTLFNNARVGDLIQALHPTPAVCGLPKSSALDFILSHEHTPRRYYSGFMGPFFPSAHTHLYVSLRCMQMSGSHCHLYAGGGLLPDSTEEQEWQETEAKLQTMARLLPVSVS